MKTAGAVVGAVVLALVVIVGCWYGYWTLDRASISNRYNNDTHNQQYQSGLIAQERDRVTAWNQATDPAQKSAIADQFCAVLQGVDPVPPDLIVAGRTMCSN